MDENIYIARDKDGALYLYRGKPVRDTNAWINGVGGEFLEMPREQYPEIKWTDRPRRLTIQPRTTILYLSEEECDFLKDRLDDLRWHVRHSADYSESKEEYYVSTIDSILNKLGTNQICYEKD